jgi:hypothetical protein
LPAHLYDPECAEITSELPVGSPILKGKTAINRSNYLESNYLESNYLESNYLESNYLESNYLE